MKTLANPRRAMRPHKAADFLPEKCAWCGKKIPVGVVFTRGHDMGKEVIVCGTCVEPPDLQRPPRELTVEDE